MYALALIFTLTTTDVTPEVIGVFKTLPQCEAASETQSSRTQCFFIDPEKGLVDIENHNTSGAYKEATAAG
ncbi:DUF1482 family protein [Citrobacter amalonaticus]|uniref:DUF1482 family protein n=1 Tax=Citrobacter amalonaticus TaxID=35703 RepID=A0A8I0T163_CITAM|nr:DUF1482 family protein [Citrobacter amalonaticus]MBE0131351.1 DUF1482 family protein [Citrobacter amalonaticus]MDV2138619.1 DUF1482 family protein [Citrobacter amalonaticus]MEB0586126.1 DUF1482 family protein [Citrobacter amalonaticus]HDZ8013772.1 DUF1482 family protein [Citrobacter amalonaticus]